MCDSSIQVANMQFNILIAQRKGNWMAFEGIETNQKRTLQVVNVSRFPTEEYTKYIAKAAKHFTQTGFQFESTA